MKNFKKLSAFVLSSLTAISMMSAVSASAATYYTEANPLYNPNTTDTTWLSGNDYVRRKFTDTSLYVKNSSMYNSVKVSVWGRRSQRGADESVGGSITTTNLTLPANVIREIRQNVNENGCTYAHIYFTNTGASGVWSPDCSGTFQKLN